MMSPRLVDSLEAAAGGRLEIGPWPGALRVRAGEPGRIEIAVWGALPARALEVEREGEAVRIAARGAAWLGWLPRALAPELRLEVSVPGHTSVEVVSCRGDVEISGVRGEVEVRGRAGLLVFSDVRGSIDGRTVLGSIDVKRCRGEVDLVTERGAIEIRDVAGRVAAHTRGGRISIADAVGELLLGSGGGPIEIAGRPTARASRA
jgi:hypothetical protein